MKIRTGFVSNSSSASFVINWECHINTGGGRSSLRSAVCSVFDIDEEHDKPSDTNDYVFEHINFVVDNSVEHRPGVFTTNFFTSMLNWPCDFGDSAAQFYFALSQQVMENGKSRFEITSTNLDKE